MEAEEKYLEHLQESWDFAQKAANKISKTKDHVVTNICLTIFDKIASPHHYFLQNIESTEDRPTDKQIKLAKKLEIKYEGLTKTQLRDRISEVLKND